MGGLESSNGSTCPSLGSGSTMLKTWYFQMLSLLQSTTIARWYFWYTPAPCIHWKALLYKLTSYCYLPFASLFPVGHARVTKQSNSDRLSQHTPSGAQNFWAGLSHAQRKKFTVETAHFYIFCAVFFGLPADIQIVQNGPGETKCSKILCGDVDRAVHNNVDKSRSYAA